jgi:glycerophosphoryl diester phosphodiesterase
VPASRFAFLDWPGPIAFAHQGGAHEFPENTMKAFDGSVGLGYRYLETDLQVTSDGVLVTFHDETLDRATDRTGTISSLPWSVVKEAKVNGTEPIPRFEDVLEAHPDVRFNIEPKTDQAVQPFIDVIQRTGIIDRICCGSFSDSKLKKIRKALGPGLCTSMGVADTARLRVASWVPIRAVAKALGGTKAACAQVPPKKSIVPIVDRRFIGFAHDLDLVVHVWTIDEADQMNHLLDLGVDGVMTDRPSVLKDVLVQRGQWST